MQRQKLNALVRGDLAIVHSILRSGFESK